MSKAQVRYKNPNWKGGRTVTEHGYVLIKVGTEHHLADVRGYAYEHRLKAEEKLERRLFPSEIVHHINGDKQDNRLSNLLVTADVAEHRVHHRSRNDLRLPGESNPLVECACGCGETLERFDSSGRPRRFISGHNPQPSPTKDAIIAVLKDGPKHKAEIAGACGKSLHTIGVALSKMKTRALVYPVERGVWAIVEE